MHTKSELLELLRANGLRLRKGLGQNYLVDPRITARLIERCELLSTDTVIEIGAGLGALTAPLAQRVQRVLAIEIDRSMAALLTSRMATRPNVQVLCHDVLVFEWSRYPAAKVVGAIPYQITSPILVKLCEHPSPLAAMWLGMQREVAQRLTARPGTKAYGRLTILVQYRFDTTQLMTIPRTAFFPQPRVDSAWVRLLPRRAPVVAVTDERLFLEVVRAAFSQRRKTLLNSLGQLKTPQLTKPEAAELLHRAGLPPRVRGEELSVETFAKLANILSDKQQSRGLSASPS